MFYISLLLLFDLVFPSFLPFLLLSFFPSLFHFKFALYFVCLGLFLWYFSEMCSIKVGLICNLQSWFVIWKVDILVKTSNIMQNINEFKFFATKVYAHTLLMNCKYQIWFCQYSIILVKNFGMPQATNLKVWREKELSPVGPGTVFNRVTEISAATRER